MPRPASAGEDRRRQRRDRARQPGRLMRLLLPKLVLGPVLLLQGRRVRRLALRLPEPPGPRAGEVPGAAGDNRPPLGLLVVGDSSAAGVGAPHQSQALAWPLARALAARTGRAVRWQLVAQSGLDTAGALALLAATPLAPAEVLVTALGVNDVTGQRAPARFRHDTEALLALARSRAGVRHALLAGVPPMQQLPLMPQPLRWYLGACAARLDAVLRGVAAAGAGRRHVAHHGAAPGPDAVADDGFHPGPAQYARWAQRLADEAAALLAAPR